MEGPRRRDKRQGPDNKDARTVENGQQKTRAKANDWAGPHQRTGIGIHLLILNKIKNESLGHFKRHMIQLQLRQ